VKNKDLTVSGEVFLEIHTKGLKIFEIMKDAKFIVVDENVIVSGKMVSICWEKRNCVRKRRNRPEHNEINMPFER
jgi:hypothetical protein